MLLKLVMIACIVQLEGMNTLQLCPERAGWWGCGESGLCISSSQVCDGQIDCDGGGDESEETCKSWVCEHGVRCQDSKVCIGTPHQAMCSGGRSVCPDGSDQAYCQHIVYSGCFVSSAQGLRISDCESCLCLLRDVTHTKLRTAAVFKSLGSSFRSSNLTGSICIKR